MLKQLIHKTLRSKHPWRTFNFNELNELYLAMLVRGISLSMMGLFVPIFLLKLDYSLTYILCLLALYFVTRVFADLGTAYAVAKIGPKHVMFIGQILFAVSSALFLTLPSIKWPIYLLAGVWGSSQSMYFIAFDVDFSKVKHKKHGGKELGYAEIMSKIGAIIGPVLGGLVAITFGPRYIFGISTVLLIFGLSPLFKTREPVRLNQKLDFKKFPYKSNIKHLPSILAVHLENSISVILWPLFIGLIVIPGSTVYIKLGILSSVSMVVAILANKTIGELVDEGYGRKVLRISAIANAALHLARPLVKTYTMAWPVDTANQLVTVGYRLSFFKAHYDHADELPGYRIVYIALSETVASLLKAIVYGCLALISLNYSGKFTLTVAFIIAAVASLIITTERFNRKLKLKPASA